MKKLTTSITIATPETDHPTRNVWHGTPRFASYADAEVWAKDHTQGAQQTFEHQGSGDGPISYGETTYERASGGVETVPVDLNVDPCRPDAVMEKHLEDIKAAFVNAAPAA